MSPDPRSRKGKRAGSRAGCLPCDRQAVPVHSDAMPPEPIAVASGPLPVLAEADCAIAGASFAGLALALDLARRGHRVTVLEGRIFPGREISAPLRQWLPRAAAGSPRPLLEPWIGGAIRPAGPGEVALIPDVMKRGLEDVMLAAGVDLQYGCLPAGLIHEGDRIAGLVAGHKSGRHAVLARCVVDATDQAVLGRLAAPLAWTDVAAEFPAAGRTLEFTGVEPAGEAAAAEALRGLAGVTLRAVHQGHAGPGHLLLELEMHLPLPSPDLAARMAAEIAARRLGLEVAARLLETAPGWARARFAHASWELARPAPWRLRDGALPAGLLVLSPATAPDAATAVRLLAPDAAVAAGEALADAADRLIRAVKPPERARCEARCGTAAAPEAGARAVRQTAADPEGIRVRTECIAALPAAQVLVAGGGTSGATTAVAAATAGAGTLLLEMNWGLGGSGTVGGVDSYWFGRRVGFTADVDARVKAVSDRLRIPAGAKWNVEAKMHALLELSEASGARTIFGSVAVGALMDGDRVRGALACTPDGLRAVACDVAIDASGDGDLAAAAGAAFTYGSPRDRLPMWYLLSPTSAPGEPQNGFTSAMDVGLVRDYTRAVHAGRRLWPGHDHAAYLAPRETRHILGGVVLGVTDHVLLRRFPDTINLCFSNCDIKGRSAADWVGWGVLPPNAELEIPYRAVVPLKIEGLLVAGKAYSCTHDYLATARMQADLQNQGGAIGLAAAQAVRRGVLPRAVDVPLLQRDLVAKGVLPAALPSRAVDGPAPSAAEVETLATALTGDEPFHLEQGFEDMMHEPLIVVRLCAAEPAAVPVLRTSFRAATGRRKLLLARILAWHGSPEGASVIADAIMDLLAGGTLPPIAWKYRYAGVPPDNGVMPEACHLLHALALVPGEAMLRPLGRIAELFDPGVASFRDRTLGVYYYADEAATAAERWGDPRAVPALRTLAGRAAVRNRSIRTLEPDFILDRLAYLEMALGRAMARCGAPDGARILIGYLGDARGLFAAHARAELGVVAGEDLGPDPAGWERWLAAHPSGFAPRPWRDRID